MRVLAVMLALAACHRTAPAPSVTFHGDCPALACARIGDAGAALTVTFEGDDLVVAATGGATVTPARIPIGAVLHKLTIRQVVGADEIDFGQTLAIATDGATPATVPVPPVKLGKQLVARLATITRGPVVLANEAAPAPRHTALLAEWSDNIVFGPAKLLEDIDWIAVPTDTALTIYERRTGKVIETKAFPSQPDRNVMKAWLAERVETP